MSARNLRAAAERILGQAQNFAATSLPTTGEIPGIVSDLASQYGDWLGRGGGAQTLQEQGSRMFSPEAVRYVTQGGQRPAFASDDPDRVLGNVMDLVNPAGKAVGLLGHLAYHGSPHRFDRFDISKIGTGEGAQAYGHGLYFAESPQVADMYAGMSKQHAVQPDSAHIHAARDFLKHDMDPSEGLRSAYPDITTDQIEAAVVEAKGGFSPNVYTVDIPDEWIPKMLDWDAPLSKQPESVKNALQMIAEANPRVLDDPIGLIPQIKEFETPEQAKEFWDFARQEWLNTPNKKDRFKPKLRSNRKIEYYPPNQQAFGNATGGQILESLRRSTGDDAFIASALRNAGIPGIKYYDQISRGAGEGTRNFVTFGDEGLRILERR